MALIVTSGGLGPTADDLTAEIVGRFAGARWCSTHALEERIAEILRPMMSRWPGLDPDAIRASNRKQAVIPEGATVLDPVGTAPGLVVPPRRRDRADRRRAARAAARASADVGDGACDRRVPRRRSPAPPPTERGILRLFGIPESEIANTLRAAEAAGLALDPLEITTCLRRGEIEVATRYEPPASRRLRRARRRSSRDRHADTLFSEDGSTIDEQVAALLEGRTVAVAESCTGGLMAARLTDRAGSSAYFLGGVVAYSNEAKVELVGVDPALIERFGAVSTEVAEALADGAAAAVRRRRSGSASPASPDPTAAPRRSPSGSCASRSRTRDGERITRSTRLPGDRADVRDRSTTVAMHLLRRLLRGEHDVPLPWSQTAAARNS